MNQIQIKRGDCLELMKEIPDKSIDMILELGVSEVIIGIDKDYIEHDYETDSQTPFTSYLHNVNKIANLFHGYCKVTVLYDKDDDLGYKDAPTDRGREIYEKLYHSRMKVGV